VHAIVAYTIAPIGMGLRIPVKTSRMAIRVPKNRAIMKTKMELDTTIVSQRKEALEKELQRIVATLIEEYKPEKIILFGSLVTGRIHDWSDIDLLIIKETTTRRVYRRAEALKGTKRNIPMDVIILTPSEVKFLCDENSLFIKYILEKGSVVYEKEKPMV